MPDDDLQKRKAEIIRKFMRGREVSIAEAALLVEESTRVLRYRLVERSKGAARKVGSRWVTSMGMLRAYDPGIADAIALARMDLE